MLAQESSPPQTAAGMHPTAQASDEGLVPLAAADLQDHLMVAQNDLNRLQRLLGDACDTLLRHFYGASHEVRSLLLQQAQAAADDSSAAPAGEAPQLHKTLEHMAEVITAMQFHDMASQLIEHTVRRLRNCTDRLAVRVMGEEDEFGHAFVEALPLRPNPVTQDEMDAGSVELF
jgi:hypothetical protein